MRVQQDPTNGPVAISRGGDAGPYQAFPDACRLPGGDIACVFYAGYGHVSLPKAGWERGGRICMVRSVDEGRTWSTPTTIHDGPIDDRDPHIAALRDGSVVVTFFSLAPGTGGRPYDGTGVRMIRSADGGRTWESEPRTIAPPGWYASAPVRPLGGSRCILGVYSEDRGVSHGGVLLSNNHGRTWSEPIPIGKGQGIELDAETDVIAMRDGTLYAALRSSKAPMHFATSVDQGRTWSPATPIGFPGHSPHFLRLRSGEIVLTHRLPKTSVHFSRDEGRTWMGPYGIDDVIGAYPATVELRDGTLLFVWYTEGEGSAIRVRRFRRTAEGIEPLPPFPAR